MRRRHYKDARGVTDFSLRPIFCRSFTPSLFPCFEKHVGFWGLVARRKKPRATTTFSLRSQHNPGADQVRTADTRQATGEGPKKRQRRRASWCGSMAEGHSPQLEEHARGSRLGRARTRRWPARTLLASASERRTGALHGRLGAATLIGTDAVRLSLMLLASPRPCRRRVPARYPRGCTAFFCVGARRPRARAARRQQRPGRHERWSTRSVLHEFTGATASGAAAAEQQQQQQLRRLGRGAAPPAPAAPARPLRGSSVAGVA